MKRSFSLYERHEQQPGGGGSCGNCKECIEREQERERMRYQNNYGYILESGNGEAIQTSSVKGKGRLEFGNNEIKNQTSNNNPTSMTTNSILSNYNYNPHHNFSTPYTSMYTPSSTTSANLLYTNTNLKRNPSPQYNKDNMMLISDISEERKFPFESMSTSSPTSISPHTHSNNMDILSATNMMKEENDNGGWEDDCDEDDVDPWELE
ncbi:4323_t:CDS:2 [Ambispora leptoticha]|uniref:4323_t:CDS:1 n=1 Tax=Ambispora leptoticha TaxID=144679 RepID=A0A9N8YTF3_9GLOM|nr:4323_t:CDS:2 [Ambispora leptoticha]